MTIILNSDVIKQLTHNDVFKILKKNQKVLGNCNYYFTPNMGISVYNPKIKFVDKKFVVLEFIKRDSLSLLLLLRHINDVFLNKLRENFSETFDKTIYNLFSEDDLAFTLRCYLPNNNGKYFVQTEDSDTGLKIPFKLPRVNTNYNQSMIEIRNVWKKNETYGFNLELKYVSL
jgi:hypothetical protein